MGSKEHMLIHLLLYWTGDWNVEQLKLGCLFLLWLPLYNHPRCYNFYGLLLCVTIMYWQFINNRASVSMFLHIHAHYTECIEWIGRWIDCGLSVFSLYWVVFVYVLTCRLPRCVLASGTIVLDAWGCTLVFRTLVREYLWEASLFGQIGYLVCIVRHYARGCVMNELYIIVINGVNDILYQAGQPPSLNMLRCIRAMMSIYCPQRVIPSPRACVYDSPSTRVLSYIPCPSIGDKIKMLPSSVLFNARMYPVLSVCKLSAGLKLFLYR